MSLLLEETVLLDKVGIRLTGGVKILNLHLDAFLNTCNKELLSRLVLFKCSLPLVIFNLVFEKIVAVDSHHGDIFFRGCISGRH